jgi:hypothetical protein
VPTRTLDILREKSDTLWEERRCLLEKENIDQKDLPAQIGLPVGPMYNSW